VTSNQPVREWDEILPSGLIAVDRLVHQYDIVLDVTLVNRTRATLPRVALELATMGDLRLAERPRPLALAPGGSATVRAAAAMQNAG
jgi:vesicle coat complex subunit